jgi:acyl-CoA hydrolase
VSAYSTHSPYLFSRRFTQKKSLIARRFLIYIKIADQPMENTTPSAKRVSESRTVMTEMVMPNDTNPMGNLMGGYLMRWMDIVAAICAGKHCQAHVVTAAVDHISFQRPIRLGDVVTLEAVVTRAFNTSVEIYVEVFANNIKGENPRRCNHAYFTFVALDENRKNPIDVPPVIPLSNEEQQLYDSADRRRELRLILSGRIKPREATELRKFFADLE